MRDHQSHEREHDVHLRRRFIAHQVLQFSAAQAMQSRVRVARRPEALESRDVFGEPEALEPAAEAATEWTFEEVPDEPAAARPLATAAAAVADALFGAPANATDAR